MTKFLSNDSIITNWQNYYVMAKLLRNGSTYDNKHGKNKINCPLKTLSHLKISFIPAPTVWPAGEI